MTTRPRATSTTSSGTPRAPAATRSGGPTATVRGRRRARRSPARFTPLVGQFTNDGKADIFWYAPGPAVDSLWDFNVNGSITKIDGATVNGTYTPIVGHFSEDSSQDIIWYVAGQRRATRGGTSTAPPAERTSRALSMNGTYTPVVGSFAGTGSPTFDYAQDILWYAPGSDRRLALGLQRQRRHHHQERRSRSTAPTPRSPATSATTASTT